MSCGQAALKEEAAFAELERAVAHRKRINTKVAIYDDHWAGYEEALTDLEASIQAYSMIVADLRQARTQHRERTSP